MDYKLYRDPGGLESTGYMEIGPGKYAGAHWQAGFVFIWGDAFGMAEGILSKHFLRYDHCNVNDIPKETGTRIIAEWRSVAERLPNLSPYEAHKALNAQASYREYLEDEIASHRNQIATMLREVADAAEKYYQQGDWICILGM